MEYHYFTIEDVEMLKFNGITHLHNHLNYLIHTDKDQKFTNEDSVRNVSFIFDNKGNPKALKWTDDLGKRIELKKKSIIRCLCKYMMTNQIYFVIFMSYVSMTEVRKAKENDYEDSIYNFGISVLWVCDMEYLPIRCEETKSSYIL